MNSACCITPICKQAGCRGGVSVLCAQGLTGSFTLCLAPNLAPTLTRTPSPKSPNSESKGGIRARLGARLGVGSGGDHVLEMPAQRQRRPVPQACSFPIIRAVFAGASSSRQELLSGEHMPTCCVRMLVTDGSRIYGYGRNQYDIPGAHVGVDGRGAWGPVGCICRREAESSCVWGRKGMGGGR